MMIRPMLFGCVAVSALAAFGAPVFAATPDAPAAAPAAAPATKAEIGDIIVTARRKNESLQSVPISITAVSQNDLTERSVTSANDLPKIATGLVVAADSGNPNQPTFSIRGRGQVFGAATGSVETYFAEIPLSSTFEMPSPPPQFFDLNTIQVLKGPQGTLFGRNTTGGAVVIVPQAPKLGVTEGYVRVQGGTYNDFQIEGAVNLPLGDKAALRIAAFDWQRKGYLNSSPTDSLTGQTQTDITSGKLIGSQNFNNVDTTQIRASLLIQPSDSVENTTVVSYQIDKSKSSASLSLDRTSETTATLGARCGKYCTFIDIDLTKPASHYFMVANTTKIDLSDNIKLKNILGYIYSTAYGNTAIDSTGSANIFIPPSGSIPIPYQANIDLALPARVAKNQQLTEELQLQGNSSDHKFTYTVGGMYDDTYQPHGQQDINIFSVSYSGLLSNFQNAVNFQASEVISKAVYASGTYSPIDRLNFSGGFRQTWVTLDQYGAQGAYAIGAAPLSVPTGPITEFVGKYKGSTYNVGADYHLDNSTMVYGGYRHGFKRGGLNPSSNGSLFDPETVDDFSAGIKTRFKLEDIPFRFNVELFYDPYTGFQTSTLTIGNAQLETVTVNVPKTRYEGFDADISAQPANWLDLSASWSYNNAKITRWVDPVDPANNLAVNPVPYVAKNKVSASARIHSELPGNIGELVLLSNYNYQSKIYTSPNSARLGVVTQGVFGFTIPANSVCAGGICGNTINGYATADLRLELNHAFGTKFDLAAGVTNLTNKYFVLGTTGTLDLGAEGYAIGAPRMFVFEIKTKF
ncbi:MAG: TonB-dependent receptor [Rudaea sp.]|nr:TonB-dependent receptor [Rudaea sp.]